MSPLSNKAALLPDELVLKVFGYLKSPRALCNVACVCRQWRDVAADYTLWRAYFQSHYPNEALPANVWIKRVCVLRQLGADLKQLPSIEFPWITKPRCSAISETGCFMLAGDSSYAHGQALPDRYTSELPVARKVGCCAITHDGEVCATGYRDNLSTSRLDGSEHRSHGNLGHVHAIAIFDQMHLLVSSELGLFYFSNEGARRFLSSSSISVLCTSYVIEQYTYVIGDLLGIFTPFQEREYCFLNLNNQ